MFLDGKPLYYPGDSDFAIYNAKCTQTLSSASELEFIVPQSNPCYDSFICRQSMVLVKCDGEEVFCGEVREVTDSLKKTKSVYCVGELAYLYDSIQPQHRFQNITPEQMFTHLINEHNSQVEEKKQFKVGIVTVKDPNDSIYRYTNYEDTLTAIREKLCDTLSGYLRIRKVNGVRYIDLVRLEDYGISCKQPVQFGVNLLDFSKNINAESIATAVVPLGARLEDTQSVEGLDAYVTIESVNNGKNYVSSADAVKQFGMVKVVQEWEDVTLPENLKKKAEEWLKSNQFADMTLEVDAIDLSMLNQNIDSFRVGDMVQAIAEPFGMNTWFPVQKKVTYLQEPAKNTITLGNSGKLSYTDKAANVSSELSRAIPQSTEILKRARENATQLIASATNGNIFMVNDEEGNPKEFLIMDTKDLKTARKVWRWNINGLGYSSNGYEGPYNLAMTMDGSIVADFITTGELSGKLIKAGTLEAETIRIAFNAISQYIQLENGGMSVYSGTVDESNKLACFNQNGMKFYRDGYCVGNIGTNYWVQDKSRKGLVFDLEPEGQYMAFAQKEEGGDMYNTVLAFTREGSIYGDYGLHAGCDLDMHNYTIKNAAFENGITDEMNFVQVLEVDESGKPTRWGANAKMKFKNGILVGLNYYT